MDTFFRIVFAASMGLIMAFLMTIGGALAVLSLHLPDNAVTLYVIALIAGAVGGQTARIVTVDDGF